MLIEFKSTASGNIVMFEMDGKEILTIVGKDETRGIITVAQMPAAQAALLAACAADKVSQRIQKSGRIGLSQRALPLIEMIERSLKENAPITWGV